MTLFRVQLNCLTFPKVLYEGIPLDCHDLGDQKYEIVKFGRIKKSMRLWKSESNPDEGKSLAKT